MSSQAIKYGFPTVFGRGLIEELRNFVHPPFLVVTMDDLWPRFQASFKGAPAQPYFVKTLEWDELETECQKLPSCEAIVGLGGGQALDIAKFFSWRKRLPLFQVPTALSVNAVYGQRSGVRHQGQILYRGWAVPQSVFIDYDVIRSAPPQLNWSGIGDILCFHTGVLDWRYAHDKGLCEPKWPYDDGLAQQSLSKVEAVIEHADAIHSLSDQGIEVLVDGLQWGTSYHGAGWCPRHIEGTDHFVFYALEAQTGKKFLHGQPVCLGVVIGSLLHEARAQQILDTIVRVGLDIRPSAMGIGWDQIEQALLSLRDYVKRAGLWHSIAHDITIAPAFVRDLRNQIERAYS